MDTKLTFKDRPHQKIDYCRAVIIALKLMIEELGYKVEDIHNFAQYLFPDIDQEEGAIDNLITCIITKPYYDVGNPNALKPSLQNVMYKEYVDLLVDIYNSHMVHA